MPEHQQAMSREAATATAEQWDRMAEQFQEKCAAQTEDFAELMEHIGSELTRYCQNRPRVVALGLLALGFMVGWKMKP